MKYLGDTSLTRLVTKIKEKIVALIPTNNNQLTNGAGYIDSTTANNTYVKKAGDTMSGALTIGSRSGTTGQYSLTNGSTDTASGNNTLATGYYAQATGDSSMANGQYCVASGKSSFASGQGGSNSLMGIKASGEGSIAVGGIYTNSGGTLGGAIEAKYQGAAAIGATCSGGTITASSYGAQASGLANSGSIQATTFGATATGNTGSAGTIKSSGAGATAMGHSLGTIQSVGKGCFAGGDTVSGGTITAGVQDDTQGCLAFGFVNNSGGIIEATGRGCVALGCSQGNGIKVRSGWNGALANGYAITGDITASREGCFAGGHTTSTSHSITSNGRGSIAYGGINSGNTINMISSGIGSAAFGSGTQATGDYSSSMGLETKATGRFQHVFGRWNTEGTAVSSNTATTGDVLIVGKGTSDSARSNAMRLTIAGKLYLQSTYSSSGADYAETTEWVDGNPNDEDRIGHFVCMVGNKMRFANSNDVRSRIGVVSAEPAVNGDSFSEEWKGKYKTDVFGRKLTRTIHVNEVKDESGYVVQPECDSVEWIIADNYDPTQEYIPREQRKEFDYFGMLGKLIVIDDGSCQVDGYCYPNNSGIATNENDANKGFYVMERLDENHIKILLK